MRIVGGALRGLKLADLGTGDAAAHLRPTSDRVREAMFNLLINGPHGNPLPGARVLDLFAGTGALALEALSRGAATACLVDDGPTALGLIRQNVARARLTDRVQVIRRNATQLAPHAGPGFDLVFLDPPYARGLGEAAMQAALRGGWLAPGATVIWEESRPPVLPAGLTPVDQRRYGDTLVTRAVLARPSGDLTQA